jgi:hypothetical protein
MMHALLLKKRRTMERAAAWSTGSMSDRAAARLTTLAHDVLSGASACTALESSSVGAPYLAIVTRGNSTRLLAWDGTRLRAPSPALWRLALTRPLMPRETAIRHVTDRLRRGDPVALAISTDPRLRQRRAEDAALFAQSALARAQQATAATTNRRAQIRGRGAAGAHTDRARWRCIAVLEIPLNP